MWSRSIALLSIEPRLYIRVDGQRHALVVLAQERCGTPCIGGWVCSSVRKTSPTQSLHSLDRPGPSEFLHRLSFPEPQGYFGYVYRR